MSDRYRVSRVVQRGGMAELLEAYVQGAAGFERRVAIKRILPDLAKDESFERAFVDEAQIVSRLQHDNIVTIFDFGTLDGLPIQVLEYVDGLDLDDLVKRARQRSIEVPVDVALHIVAQVARGLDYLHDATGDDGRRLGLVHRDISPDNILVSFSGGVKIADFGIALADERTHETSAGVVKGKPAYMAPEQAAGAGVGPATDQYALALVLCFLLTGKSPLEEEAARMLAYSRAHPPLDPSLDEDVRALLSRALAFDPHARFESAGAFAEACLALRPAAASADALGRLLDRLREAEPMAPFADLFDFELDDAVDTPVRRFATVVGTAPSILHATIHGYRVVQLMDRTDDTAIYLAQHTLLGDHATLEVFEAETDPDDVARFSRRVAAVRDLAVDGVARIEGCGTLDDGRPFLLTERPAGAPLAAGSVPRSEGPAFYAWLAATVEAVGEVAPPPLTRIIADGHAWRITEPGLMDALRGGTQVLGAGREEAVVRRVAEATGAPVDEVRAWRPGQRRLGRMFAVAALGLAIGGAGIAVSLGGRTDAVTGREAVATVSKAEGDPRAAAGREATGQANAVRVGATDDDDASLRGAELRALERATAPKFGEAATGTSPGAAADGGSRAASERASSDPRAARNRNNGDTKRAASDRASGDPRGAGNRTNGDTKRAASDRASSDSRGAGNRSNGDRKRAASDGSTSAARDRGNGGAASSRDPSSAGGPNDTAGSPAARPSGTAAATRRAAEAQRKDEARAKDARARLTRAMARRHVVAADLPDSERAAYEAAIDAKDWDAVERRFAELERRIDAAAITEPVLRRRLEKIATRLAARSDRALEMRYLDIRQALAQRPPEARRRAIGDELTALEAALR
ncbi:MAG: protein kinase [Deltaproteobacteria bacterium]|jgi:tRNA A-37 threonylcarbamoyl transferase component Bud32